MNVGLTIIVVFTTLSASKADFARCASDLLDITLVLDDSTSIQPASWPIVLESAVNIVRRFEIGPQNARFAVVTYSTFAKVEFNFLEYQTKASLITAIRNLPRTTGLTNIAHAIYKVRSDVYTNFAGNRLAAKDIVIFYSDGKPTLQIRQIARQIRKAHREGLFFVSVGIGNYDRDIMRAISTHGRVLSVNQVHQLNSIIDRITEETCEVAEEPEPPEEDTCLDDPLDIALVLDASTSITRFRWQKVLEFAVRVVRRFPIGLNGARFSVVTYSTSATVEFNLHDHHTHNSLERAIRSLSYTGGVTNMGRAFDLIRTDVFKERNGDRPSAKNVAILLSDGAPTDNLMLLSYKVNRVKDEGTIILSVGVTRSINAGLLRFISSNDRVISVDSFDEMPAIVREVARTTCDVTEGPDECARYAGDVTFILDASGSVGSANWRRILRFVTGVVQQFTVSQNDFRFGVVKYSTNATVEYRLNEFNTQASLIQAINNIAYTGGMTNIAHSLELARTDIFQPQYGDRPDVNNVAIMITDGRPNKRTDETEDQAIYLKNAKTYVISVGVGNQVNSTLLDDIASDKSYVGVTSFVNLNAVVGLLAIQTCQVAGGDPLPEVSPCSKTCGIGRRQIVVDGYRVEDGINCCLKACPGPGTGLGGGLLCRDMWRPST